MNNDEIAIEVSDVSKAYRLLDTPAQRVRYYLFRSETGTDYKALDNVSFSIAKGEFFGIVGKNGSGKSTMLQILAGIIKPSSGEVKVHGRVAALLELGSGFNMESTGIENIYMNAAIMGISRNEIKKKVNEIIEFADIGDHLYQPVKTYSSGMYIRLAFAVAINVDADILLIDEALAVGDVFFRQKCYQKLEKLRGQQKTIILVSHAMNEVQQFCQRALLLNNGRTVLLGDSRTVVDRYYAMNGNTAEFKITGAAETRNKGDAHSINRGDLGKRNANFGGYSIQDDDFFDLEEAQIMTTGKAELRKIGIFDENGKSKRSFLQGEYAYIYQEVEVKEDIGVPLVGIVIDDHRGIIVHGKDNLQIEADPPMSVKTGSIVASCQKVQLNIAEGEYIIDSGFSSIAAEDYKKRTARNQEEVNATLERIISANKVGSFIVHSDKNRRPMKMPFHGMCDLDGDIRIAVM